MKFLLDWKSPYLPSWLCQNLCDLFFVCLVIFPFSVCLMKFLILTFRVWYLQLFCLPAALFLLLCAVAPFISYFGLPSTLTGTSTGTRTWTQLHLFSMLIFSFWLCFVAVVVIFVFIFCLFGLWWLSVFLKDNRCSLFYYPPVILCIFIVSWDHLYLRSFRMILLVNFLTG